MQSLRRFWLSCHRWTALCLGWVLILSGITGSLLVVARPLDGWLHPEYFQVAAHTRTTPDASDTPDTPNTADSPDSRRDSSDISNPPRISQIQVPLEALRRQLAGEFGPRASFTFRPPREADETMQVLVRAGAWRGTLYLNPWSGEEQGRRGENEGFVQLLYGLHSALWMDQTGKAVLACAALSYLVLFLTGIVLWWPRKWPPTLRVEFGRGWTRALFDLHRTGGALLALALALSIVTGAYLAWRPIGGWITWLSGAPRTTAPALPPGGGPFLPLDDLAARAQAAFPDGTIGYFLYTGRTDRPLAVRMHVPDDPHPNGRSTVWLDPRSGAVLARQRWDELDPGTRINSFVYPLHTGELGGWPWQGGVAVLGLTLGVLGSSGIWLWWRRRAARGDAVKSTMGAGAK